MAWRLADALRTLRDEVNDAAPGRSKLSDGGIGNAEHASRSSDHNPWIKDATGTGVVRAYDFTNDPGDGFDAGAFAERVRRLGAAGDRRLRSGGYVIWNRRIASSGNGWAWKHYPGTNPHDKHVHVSVSRDRDGYDDSTRWSIALAAITPPGGSTPVPAAQEAPDMHRVQVKAPGHPFDGRIYLVTPVEVKHLSGTQNTAFDHLPLYAVNQAEPAIMADVVGNSPLARAVREARDGGDDLVALVDDLPAETAEVLFAKLRDRLA